LYFAGCHFLKGVVTVSMMKRYVILPAFGFESPVLAASSKLRSVGETVRLEARHGTSSSGGPAAKRMHVLHSTHENGPKLVEMTEDAELNLRAELPGVKVVPLTFFRKMRVEYRVEHRLRLSAATASVASTVQVSNKQTSRPVAGARIVAYTNYERREGAEATSAKNGAAKLRLKPGTAIDRLYVLSPAGYWGYYARSFKLKADVRIGLSPIDLEKDTSLLGRFTSGLPVDSGNAVKVAVVDSGVARDHPGLPNAKGGLNLVLDETQGNLGAQTEWGPAKKDGEHGTHVAGIIGARPFGKIAIRGVAPGVELRSYRVFPDNGGDATNYDIMNAIDRAVLDGCDIVNLSLGGGDEDEAVRAAIGKALDMGVVVVAAAGNDGRRSVAHPAALASCVAVSAMGARGSFPKDSTEESEAIKPFGDPDQDSFVAAFSNIGPQIDVIGPGVGVVSTLPEKGYGVMSGTSMASPAIAGIAAYLLASDPAMLNAKKSDRAKLLKEALYQNCRTKAFGRDYEGFGYPRGKV
jgi:subtilisin